MIEALKKLAQKGLYVNDRGAPVSNSVDLPTLKLADLERRAIFQALKRAGTVSKAAQLLGIGRATLYRRIQVFAQERRRAEKE
jgi:transcriptional regulator of acetoin/glycerol metabolism